VLVFFFFSFGFFFFFFLFFFCFWCFLFCVFCVLPPLFFWRTTGKTRILGLCFMMEHLPPPFLSTKECRILISFPFLFSFLDIGLSSLSQCRMILRGGSGLPLPLFSVCASDYSPKKVPRDITTYLMLSPPSILFVSSVRGLFPVLHELRPAFF